MHHGDFAAKERKPLCNCLACGAVMIMVQKLGAVPDRVKEIPYLEVTQILNYLGCGFGVGRIITDYVHLCLLPQFHNTMRQIFSTSTHFNLPSFINTIWTPLKVKIKFWFFVLLDLMMPPNKNISVLCKNINLWKKLNLKYYAWVLELMFYEN